MNKKKNLQHRNIVKVHGADALRSVTDELKGQGYFPAPMPNDFGHHSNNDGPNLGLWEDYIHAKLTCQEPGTPSASKQYATLHLSSGIEVPTPDNIGTPGLGYMEWGIGNRKPSVMTLLREASPYTASAHRFNTDLCAGKGPRFVYSYVQYIGGNITEKRISFKDAGVLIKGWIRDLKRELRQLEEPAGEPAGVVAGVAGTVASGLSADEGDDLAKDIREQIETLEKEYDQWEKTNEFLTNFGERNNLALTYLSLTEDMQDQNLCFAEITLNKRTLDDNGKNVPTKMWLPSVTGIKYRSAHTCRLERKDKNGRINYVYISSGFLTPQQLPSSATDKGEDVLEMIALPALDPQSPLTDLERIVRETRKENGSIRKRPTRFIIPIAYPSAGRPYYPVPAWQSIFSGDIYEYLMTMISDRNKRRKNSNVIGRILYLNNEYMERLYFQNKADTPAAKLEVFSKLREQINSFLMDRDNTGKPLVAYTFLGSDGKVYESWKIVEIEANNKQTAEANQKELAEISSIVFFAFGLDSRLVGNSPGDVASSGGTDLRERYLLKQVQMAPMQNLMLMPLYLMKAFNGLDPHLEFEIPREVLTTLDNSKTGITNAEQPS
jgi:hypothetical protein